VTAVRGADLNGALVLPFRSPSPAPLNNTAQALVAQCGDKLMAGDRVKWAQCPVVVTHLKRIAA
jgi:hypothetical protein